MIELKKITAQNGFVKDFTEALYLFSVIFCCAANAHSSGKTSIVELNSFVKR